MPPSDSSASRQREARARRGAHPPVLRVDPGTADGRAILRAAAQVLRGGALVAFPTDTLFALGADALSPRAVARVARAKGRGGDQPIPVLVSGVRMAHQVVRFSGAAGHLARAFWPGGLTLVLPARAGLPRPLTGGTGTIGVRVPDHPLALGLVRALGRPITGTSANPTGARDPRSPRGVARALGTRVALILDGGPTPRGRASTVVSLRGNTVGILRVGAVSPAHIRRALAGETNPLRGRGVSDIG